MARRYSPGSKAKMYSAKVSQIQENPISDFSSIKFWKSSAFLFQNENLNSGNKSVSGKRMRI